MRTDKCNEHYYNIEQAAQVWSHDLQTRNSVSLMNEGIVNVNLPIHLILQLVNIVIVPVFISPLISYSRLIKTHLFHKSFPP